MKILAYIIGAIGVIALLVGLALLTAYPLMWAINYTFTSSVLLALFGVPQITFWKTVLLSIVTGWLFKGGSSSSSSK
jgi:hypothetical protein